jgi:hypothetical protein
MGLSLRALRTSLASLALIVLGACDRSTAPIDGDFRGIYFVGWEASVFRGCFARESWWMSGELGPIFDALPAESQPPWEAAAYVHVRGTRSKRGSYGHLGTYPYELAVREVLDASADTAGECR